MKAYLHKKYFHFSFLDILGNNSRILSSSAGYFLHIHIGKIDNQQAQCN